MKLVKQSLALASLLIVLYSCNSAKSLNKSALYEDDEVYYQPGETFITEAPTSSSNASTTPSVGTNSLEEDDYYSGNTNQGDVINNYYGDVDQFNGGLNNNPGRFMYDPLWGWRYTYWDPFNNGMGGLNMGFGMSNNCWGCYDPWMNNGWGWNDPWMNNGWGWNDPWMNNGWGWNNGWGNGFGWNNGWNNSYWAVNRPWFVSPWNSMYGNQFGNAWAWNNAFNNDSNNNVQFGNRGGAGSGFNNNSSGTQEFQTLNPRKQPGRPDPGNSNGKPVEINDDFFSVPSRSGSTNVDQGRPTREPSKDVQTRPNVAPSRPSRPTERPRDNGGMSRPAPSSPAPSRGGGVSSPNRGGGSSPAPSRGGGGTRRR